MLIKIHLSGISKELAGSDLLTLDLKNNAELLAEIKNAIPDLNKYYFAVSINGRLTVDFSSINEKDEILVFSPYAGG